MAIERPLVRVFVACEEIQTEPTAQKVSLVHVFHRIVRLPGEPFPCVCQQMALYALLTNGRGEHDFGVEMTFFDQGKERQIYGTLNRRINLGPDPLVVHGLPIPHMKVRFDVPGLYSFHLLCDDKPLASYPVEVR